MKFKNFFIRTETSTLSAALIIMVSLLAANVLGLLKLRIFAHLFSGASSDLGLFLASDRIPNFVFNVLAIGALSSSFIPVFSRNLASGNKEKAFAMASTLFNLSFLVFSASALLFFVSSVPVLRLFSWDAQLSQTQETLLNSSSKILFLAQLFFLFSAFSSGILQSFGNFTSVAIAPVVFNLTVIAFTVLLSGSLGIIGAAWATVLGALFHFLVQVPTLFSLGFVYKPIIDLKDKMFLEIGRLFIPRTLSLIADQLGALLLTSFSLSISATSVVIFSFAQRLELIPVVLFGSAFAQASFATLSKNAEVNQSDFLAIFRKTFYYLSFLILPSSVFLIVLRIPLVRIFFGSRGFDWSATVLTAHTLSLFSLGLFFQAQSGLLARAFFALKNTRVPFAASAISLIVGGLFGFVAVRFWNFDVWSLGLAAALIDFVDFFLLYFFLSKKFGVLRTWDFVKPVIFMTFSAFLSGVISFVLVRQLDLRFSFFDTRYFVNLLLLTTLSLLVGGGFYLLISYKLGINEGKKALAWAAKLRSFGQTFVQELFQE